MFKNITAILFLATAALHAQQSTFDADNENWGASGDPLSSIATWIPTDGNPGGHIRVTDAATGGTWYFDAPPKFRGNKCDAYDRYLRWDQYTSDITQPYTGRPDVVIEGAGLTLVFDNGQIPGLTWTHYDVLLREDAGWRLGNLTGPVPTEAQFRTVLANVSTLRIRGEYRPGPDFGGLDNVVLESNFRFDLDADNSSGITDGGFATDTLCDPYSPVVDADAVLFSEKPVDSVSLRILLAKDSPLEVLDIVGALPPALSLRQNAPDWLALVNNGSATVADFVAGLQAVRYANNALTPTRGERFVAIRLYGECGDMGLRYTYVRVFPPGDAGLPADTTLCADGPVANLFFALGGTPDPGGYWQPSLPGGLFNPAADAPNTYKYIVPGVGACPGDSAAVTVTVEQPFDLRADTTLCYGAVLLVSVPTTSLTSWEWSTGSQRPVLEIVEPGTYALTGQTANCLFQDSVRVQFFTCNDCPVYAPNIFSPNDDGWNDTWQVFLPCLWQRFRLEVFDRWGNQVFLANDPEQAWDGKWQNKPVPPGVYVWSLEWEGEKFGEPQVSRQSGDVTVLR